MSYSARHLAAGRARTSRADKAAVRVILALARVSRDKWLPPSEVTRIASRLASCCSGHPENTVAAAVQDECFAVGMYRGAPPIQRGHPGYRKSVLYLRDQLAKEARRRPTNRTIFPELTLLNALIEGAKHVKPTDQDFRGCPPPDTRHHLRLAGEQDLRG